MPDDDVTPDAVAEVLDTTAAEPAGALTKPEWDAIADAHPAVVEFVRAAGKRRRLGVRTQALRKIAEAASAEADAMIAVAALNLMREKADGVAAGRDAVARLTAERRELLAEVERLRSDLMRATALPAAAVSAGRD